MSVNNNLVDPQMPENQETNQPLQQLIMMYMTQKDKTIKNRGYIDMIKASFNT